MRSSTCRLILKIGTDYSNNRKKAQKLTNAVAISCSIAERKTKTCAIRKKLRLEMRFMIQLIKNTDDDVSLQCVEIQQWRRRMKLGFE